jgi:hypothetical protein
VKIEFVVNHAHRPHFSVCALRGKERPRLHLRASLAGFTCRLHLQASLEQPVLGL